MNNQIHLPDFIVAEIGFRGDKFARPRGAKTVWYHHKEEDKAVLGPDLERDSLEICGVAALSGIKKADLNSDGVSGARVTITRDLPGHLYTALTGSDQVVLKPLYAFEYEKLPSTMVPVYPATEYDEGKLSNVEQSSATHQDGPNTCSRVTSCTTHTNSV